MVEQGEQSRACVGRVPRVLPCHALQRQGLLQIYAAQHTLVFYTTLPANQSDASGKAKLEVVLPEARMISAALKRM